MASATSDDKNTKSLRFIEEMTRNTDSVQERVLAKILSQNAETEYLKRFELNGATDRDTFKSKVPVVSYEDLKPDIQRLVNGDRSPIFSAHPISELFTSSGTSAGERKLIPTIAEEMDRRSLLFILFVAVINSYMPEMDKGKALQFMFIKSETKSLGGLVARPVLSSCLMSDQFKNRPYNVNTSPDEAILCPDSFQSMYTQMLCGLIMRHEVLRVGAVFASGLLRAIGFLQLNWAELAHDISTGTLNTKVTDLAIKHRMAQILKPDPKLADFIVKECSGENWERIITRIWPNTKYLDVIVTGSMARYIPTLDYYSGGLPIVCSIYTSSECSFGINLNPICNPSDVSYTIMPNMSYFEFLPHGDDVSRDSLPISIDLADVELGKSYEIVVTTYSGLCRYRVGDILQVTGFHNAAPQFRFVRRKNVLLSIDVDKTDEVELQNAVENASALLLESSTRLLDYTSFADTKAIPGHYVIYWELPSPTNAPTSQVLAQCCLRMEESLNAVYRQCRVADRTIGPLEIRVVKNGTFEELMDYVVSRGASISQYKVPRCVTCTSLTKLLDSRAESVYFSPAEPHWNPPECRRSCYSLGWSPFILVPLNHTGPPECRR